MHCRAIPHPVTAWKCLPPGDLVEAQVVHNQTACRTRAAVQQAHSKRSWEGAESVTVRSIHARISGLSWGGRPLRGRSRKSTESALAEPDNPASDRRATSAATCIPAGWLRTPDQILRTVDGNCSAVAACTNDVPTCSSTSADAMRASIASRSAATSTPHFCSGESHKHALLAPRIALSDEVGPLDLPERDCVVVQHGCQVLQIRSLCPHQRRQFRTRVGSTTSPASRVIAFRSDLPSCPPATAAAGSPCPPPPPATPAGAGTPRRSGSAAPDAGPARGRPAPACTRSPAGAPPRPPGRACTGCPAAGSRSTACRPCTGPSPPPAGAGRAGLSPA